MKVEVAVLGSRPPFGLCGLTAALQPVRIKVLCSLLALNYSSYTFNTETTAWADFNFSNHHRRHLHSAFSRMIFE